MGNWKDDWTAEVVGRAHHAEISMQDLAAESGFSPVYLSLVLHKRKGGEKTKDVVLAALSRLEKKKEAAG